MKEGVPSLQTSLSSRELPPRPRHLKSKNLICFLSGGVMGEVFRFGWEVELRHYRVIPMVELRSRIFRQTIHKFAGCSSATGKNFCEV